MATAISGFITITGTTPVVTAGPATGAGTFVLIANPANTGTYCYVGNNGSDTVSSTTGYPLSKTLGNQVVVTVGTGGLAELYFLSDTQNDDIIYLKIAGEGDGVAAV
jgi:hypothetical protein